MNWTLTILSVLIFVFGVWPGIGDEVVTQWVVGVSAVLILIISWTGVTCKPCSMKKAGMSKKKR